MNNGILFAAAAATFFGLWTVFHQLASGHIDKIFGAILVSLTAVIIGLPILLLNTGSSKWVSDPKGFIFLILAGLCAFCIDFFVLKAYASGLPISIGGPIVIGGSIAVAVVAGFFLGEEFSLLKTFGIALIIIGAIILSRLTV